MTDPFEALHEPETAASPDPLFAERLRERITRALLAPETNPTGVTMPATTTDTTPPATAAADLPLHSLTPYLAVDDARRAIDWYQRVFGAERRGDPIVMADDRIGHAELAVGDSVLMLADEFPEIGVRGPRTLGGTTLSLQVRVPDADATVARAAELGAEVTRPVADQPYGRGGTIDDPFGHRWMVVTAPHDAAAGGPRLRHGDIGYAALWTPDAARAADFYQRVLGWRYAGAPGAADRGRQIPGTRPPLGIWGEQPHGTLRLKVVVDDVAAAVERVRAAGGVADAPVHEPWGLSAACTDDQGMPFGVYEPPADAPGRAASAGHGELAYVTIGTVDSARFRAFFGAVFGWEFSPGRVEDGWGVMLAGGEQVSPMTGMHGGADAPTVVPMFAVDDVVAAARAVRAAGGTAPEPQSQPYGITTECTDDQGVSFYLGQLG